MQNISAPSVERNPLQLEKSGFEYHFPTAQQAPGFSLAVPAGVQVSQSWAVDQTLEVERYQLHITQASFQAGVVEGTIIRLTIDQQPGLVWIGLICKNLEVCSSSGFDLAQPGQPMTTDVYLNRPLERTIDIRAQILLETASGPGKSISNWPAASSRVRTKEQLYTRWRLFLSPPVEI